MGKFFAKLFSPPEALDAIIKTGDAIVYTKEERFQASMKMTELLGPQNLARRILTFVMAGTWLLCTLNMVTLLNFVIFMDSITLERIEPFTDFYGYVCLLYGGVLTFYYGAHFKRAK